MVSYVPQSRYDDVLQHLRQARASLRCADVKAQLEQLGFRVRDAKKGNHKLYFHDHIAGFQGSNYDCGHEKHVKTCYIRNIIGVIEKYELEIRTFLGNDHD